MTRNDSLLLLLPLGLATAAWSQTAIDLRTQTKDVDFSGAVSTKPFRTGTSLPSTCTTGAAFLNLAAAAGQNIYLCTATNTWTQQDVNQPITWTASGDIGGTAAGATSLAPALTVTGLRGAAVPTLSTGNLRYSSGTFSFDSTAYQPQITTGTTGQYFRGDLSLAAFPTNLNSFTNGPGYITGNQSITLTSSGDVSGSASGTTSITPAFTVTGLRGVALPSLATGNLRYSGGVWVFDSTAYLSSMWGAGSRPVAANALGASGNCVAWGSVGLVDAGAPCGSGNGSGSGASMFQQLGDFALTYAGPSGTIGASCSASTPCVAAVGYDAYSFPSAAIVTESGSGNDTLYVYVNGAGTLTVGYSGATAPACSGCTVAAGITGYPAGVAMIGRYTVSGGSFAASVSDRASITGPATLAAGSNVTISTAGNVVTISSSGGGSGSLPSTAVQTNQSNSYTTGTQDFRSAGHTLPMVTGTAASKPGTCTAGETYFATDATAGQNVYFCTATNTWTQMSAGGGSSCVTTAGQGYWFPFGSTENNNINNWPATPHVYQLTAPCGMTIGKIGINVTTASGTACTGGVCGLVFGLYNSSGSLIASTTPLVSGGTPNLNSTGEMLASFSTAQTLSVGTAYYLAMWTDSNALTVESTGNGWSWQAELNLLGNLVGYAGNNASGDGASVALPSSMGTVNPQGAGYGNAPLVVFAR